jgi:ubiquitin-protein ligase E3 A
MMLSDLFPIENPLLNALIDPSTMKHVYSRLDSTSTDNLDEVFVSEPIVVNMEPLRMENPSNEKPSVFSWGRSDFDCLVKKRTTDVHDGYCAFHPDTRHFVSVSSNLYHTIALTATGGLYSCGKNDHGQLGLDTEHPFSVVDQLQLVESLATNPIISVSCGLMHTVCVTASGSAMSFGCNESGQLGHSSEEKTKVAPKPVNFSLPAARLFTPLIIAKVACGAQFSLFLTASGEVYGCGSSSFVGNEPRASKLCIYQAERVESFVGASIRDIAAGYTHSFALATTGELYAWGSNNQSQLGIINPKSSAKNVFHHQQTPKLVNLPSEIMANDKIIGLSAGYAHSIFWTQKGYLYGTGSNQFGQLGLPFHHSDVVETFESITMPSFVVTATCGYNHTLVLCSGTSDLKQFNFTKEHYSFMSNPLVRMSSYNSDSCSSGCCSPEMASKVKAKQQQKNNININNNNINSTISSDTFRALLNKNTITTATIPEVAAVNEDEEEYVSRVYGFGSNNYGQISSSSADTMFFAPKEISELPGKMEVDQVLYISAGGDHSFAIGLLEKNQFLLPPFREWSEQYKSGKGGQPPRKQSGNNKTLLKKALTSTISKVVTPMRAKAVMKLIQKCTFDQNLANSTINTVCELFSSPSLIGGSFKKRSRRAHAKHTAHSTIDVEGLDAVYTAFIALGKTPTARLTQSIQQSVTELENACTASNRLALPESCIRIFLILWQCPVFTHPSTTSELFLRLLKMISAYDSKVFAEFISNQYPASLFGTRLLHSLHKQLDYFYAQDAQRPSHYTVFNNTEARQNQVVPVFKMFLQTFSWLHEINLKKKFVTNEAFYNKTISSLPENALIKDYISWRIKRDRTFKHGSVNEETWNWRKAFYFADYPYLISALAKKKILFSESTFQQQEAQQAPRHYNIQLNLPNLNGNNSGSSRNNTITNYYFLISIQREHLLQQAIFHIANALTKDLKKPLKVKFRGEEGIDEGGVRKEFFQLVFHQLFNFDFGMFLPVENSRFVWINKDNHWSIDEYTLVGTLLGLALYNSILVDMHFPRVFYKKLLQLPLEYEDLKSIDLELYNGLEAMLHYEPKEDIEDVFCRTFSVEYPDEFDCNRMKTIDLIPDGRNIVVNHSNCQLYVEVLVNWLLNDSVSKQFDALYKGFCRIMNPLSLLLISPEELELLMVGSSDLDFKELEGATKYIGGIDHSDWNAEHRVIQWFWELVHNSLSFEDKQHLLCFVTGCNKAPIGGLKNIGLKIQRMGPDSEHLPTSHTCFNTLLIPEYSSKRKLENRLRIAIRECEGFGLK